LGIDTEGISCCFDQESQRMLKDYRKKGLGDTAVAIADAITKDGFSGSSVLEVGCGFGGLTLELIRRGASSAVGLDLSPKMIQLANTLAAEYGLSSSVSFQLGDGAVVQLKKSDVVILDTVLCCYPDVKSLVDNSSSSARRCYAISIPDDTRLATKAMKLVLPLQRAIFRRDSFRFFIHPTRRIREMLEEKGFRLVSKSSTGWIWSVLVFKPSGAA
jgi:magnesium-protoporphyrin O-methyltransferase